VTKRRPVVILSSGTYHAERPDVIAGLLTGNIAAATKSSDYVLEDWREAGLDRPTAFCAYVGTHSQGEIGFRIGSLSSRDYREVLARVRIAFGIGS
jgi:mRNA interferase MazF